MNESKRRSPLDWVLNIFAEVRAGEGTTAVLLMLNMFLLLGGYYLLKTIREPLVLAAEGGGAEVKSYASAAIAALLIVLVPLYGGIAARVSRVRLINGVTAFFIACLIGFFFWAKAVGVAGMPPAGDEAALPAPGMGQLALGVAFFIWVGIYNLMVIAQFWAFANDVYTVQQGKRLFAIVLFGSSIGAIAGSLGAKPLIEAYGLYPLMAIAAVMLVLCMLLTNSVHGREKAVESGAAAKDAPDQAARDAGAEFHDPNQGIKGRNGFALVFSDRYLILIASLMLLLNLVNTTGEYILGETLTRIGEGRIAQGQLAQADLGTWIGVFYSDYFSWVNIVAAVVQALFVSRIIRLFGIRGGILVLPVIALGAYATLAFLPLLAVIRVAKIAENSFDYSLNNTARQALFLPTTREVKYKAKQAVDTFFVRLGDVISAGLVFAGTTWLAFQPHHFAMANAVLVLVWLGVAFVLGRMFQERSGER